MADVKVPPMLHKMSVAAQKAWYKKNKMEYPGAGGKEGRSAAQAKKDVGEINKKKAREAAIARAAASKKNKALVSSSERVREMGRRRRESGEGLGGGLETNRDILSYVRAGGTIKAGRLGEETTMNEVTKAEAEKVLGGPVKEKPKMPPGKQPAGYRYVRSLARKAMKAGMKKEEVEQTDEALRIKDTSGSLGNLEKAKPGASPSAQRLAQDTRNAVARDIKKIRKDTEPFARKQALSYYDYDVRKEAVSFGRSGGVMHYDPKTEKSEKPAKGVSALDKDGNLVGHYRDLETAKKMKPGHTYQTSKGVAKEEVEQTDEALLPKQQAVADKLKASELAANKEKAGYKFGKDLRAAKVAAKMKEEVEYIEEKLTAADPASKWISDFVASDNPKFAGKTKKERIQMALGAYYAAKGGKNESIEFLESKKMKDYEDDMEDEMDDEDDDMEDEDDEKEMNGKKRKKMEERYMGFKKLVSTIKAKGGARNPAAVAAAIGRKKYGAEKFQAAAAAGKKMSEAVLDPVGREDKDIDNDGDSDKTDVYLSKRRKAISSAIRKKVSDKMGK